MVDELIRGLKVINAEIIEKIETQIVDLPLKRIHKFSATSIISKEFLLVRVYSRSSLMGIGEATTPGGPWWAGEAIETIKVMIDQYFAPYLIGEDALNVIQLMSKLEKVVGNTFAKAAIEMSLLDLKGRALEVPVYQLLGGLYRESSRINWPLAMGDAKLDIEEAEKMMDDNLAHNFKVKMGYLSPQDDVNYLGELCKGLCDNASVHGDLNGAWDESQARSLLPVLEEHGMKFIEQPLQYWNRSGLARVREMIGMPILADESVRTIQDALALTNLAAADVMSFKPLKSGGLLVCQQIAAIAAASGVACYAGTFLESSIGTASMMHWVAATANIDYGNELVGPIWLADDLVQEPVEYRDNQVWVKHGPGLGVDLNEDKVKHYLRN
ncbi:MAG: muconate/chloromuconate family cycloisomerase [Pseudomonadales bacterium]